MSSSPPPRDPIDSGRAHFIGIILNWALYGLLISQTFTYYVTFPHDTRVNKTITCSVFLLETLQTALLTHGSYHTFVLNPGNTEFLDRIGLLWLAIPVLCGIVGWIAGLFYANRIYRVSGSRKVSGVIVALSFIQLAAAIMVGLQARSAESFDEFRRPSDQIPHPVAWPVSMTLCDTIIAVAMTYYLVRLRREFHLPSSSTSHRIRQLTILTIETGVATALTAITAGVLFVVAPDSNSFNTPGFVAGKLYSNSLMRVLNSRNRMEYTGDVASLPQMMDLIENPAARCPTCDEEGRIF